LSGGWNDFGFAQVFQRSAMNVERYKQRLLGLEQELRKRVGQQMETARGAGDDQADPGDIARIDEIKDEYVTAAETDASILAQVRAALERIVENTYGRCVVDGGPIDEKRLDSLPWTPFCLKHQQEMEARSRVRTPTL
jgi:DnaK suppressor protein